MWYTKTEVLHLRRSGGLHRLEYMVNASPEGIWEERCEKASYGLEHLKIYYLSSLLLGCTEMEILNKTPHLYKLLLSFPLLDPWFAIIISESLCCLLGSCNQLDVRTGTWDVSVLSLLQCASAIPFHESVFHDLKGFEICSFFFQNLSYYCMLFIFPNSSLRFYY